MNRELICLTCFRRLASCQCPSHLVKLDLTPQRPEPITYPKHVREAWGLGR